MPTEIEVPTEHLHEALHEAAHHGGHAPHEGDGPPSWVGQVALSAAILAVAAAITALLAGHHANEAMIEQMKANDEWSFFQAKALKESITQMKIDVFTAVGKEAGDEDKKRIAKYQAEQEELKKSAEESQRASAEHMGRHVKFARSVTAFQVAIALSAISALTRKRAAWFLGLALGAIGTALLVQALL